MTEEIDKVRENRARRSAQRQGFTLVKSRLRDPRAIGYGTFVIVNTESNVAEGSDAPLSLDDVEQFLGLASPKKISNKQRNKSRNK